MTLLTTLLHRFKDLNKPEDVTTQCTTDVALADGRKFLARKTSLCCFYEIHVPELFKCYGYFLHSSVLKYSTKVEKAFVTYSYNSFI